MKKILFFTILLFLIPSFADAQAGCTDPNAHNYDATATTNDGSCETCFDGIKNGDEFDVDCGGSNPNCAACIFPNPLLCVDGYINDEVIFEDGFEDGTLSPFTTSSTSSAAWVPDNTESNNGSWSAFADLPSNCSGNANLQYSVFVPSGSIAEVSFALTFISASITDYQLKFFINGVLQDIWSSSFTWSDFFTYKYTLGPGFNTLRWETEILSVCIDLDGDDSNRIKENQSSQRSKLAGDGIYIDDVKVTKPSNHIVRIKDGNEGLNKILVSDNDGNTTWFSPNEWTRGYNGPWDFLGDVSIDNGHFSIDESTFYVNDFTNRVGIGTNSPLYPLHVVGSRIRLGSNSFGTKSIDFRTDGNELDITSTGGRLHFYANGGEHIVLAENFAGTGNVGIGTSSPSYKLEVSGSAGKPGGGSWSNSSDRRLKTDIKDFSKGLDLVNQVEPISFHYNGKLNHPTEQEYVGVIAQELQKIAPFMVSDFEGDDGETYLAVDPSAFDFILINAVQELSARLEKLEKANLLLQEKNEQLTTQLKK